jgi:hypothetical protein
MSAKEYVHCMKEEVVSMGTRIEVTKQLKGGYHRARKSEKSRILDHFCQSTGLGRSTARRYLTSPTLGSKNIVRIDRRRSRPSKYSTAAKEKLLWLWRIMCMPCGKYLVADLPFWVASLEAHGELKLHCNGWTEEVREELLSMSAATMDRYLKAERDRLRLKGISTTKPGVLLRNSIQIRKAGDEVSSEPGFFETDTVAHCGPTLKGEFARTLTMTDVAIGWIQLEVMRNNAHKHIRVALDDSMDAIPYQVLGLDCDNGSELVNYDVVSWAADRDIFFTRARPYRKNDQAHVESKNNHVVRRYGFYYRYDTAQERETLAALWELVTLKMNYFTATRKPRGWETDEVGRRKRIYDKPQTPLSRLLQAEILSPEQARKLIEHRDSINPAELTRNINRLQGILTGLAKSKTDLLIEEAEEAKRLRLNKQQGGVRVVV